MKRKAFTVVELLVVIGIIALLVSIVIPALNSARQTAKRATCASNMRQIGSALMMYARDNDGQFPQHDVEGRYLWDIGDRSLTALVNDGAAQGVWYDPADPDRQQIWRHNFNPGGNPGWFAVGYLLLYQRPFDPGGSPMATVPPPNHQPPLQKATLVTNFRSSDGATTPLVGDSIVDMGGNFANIPGGYYNDRTAHLTRKGLPEGGNLLFCDGHVDWRPFNQVPAQQLVSGEIVPRYTSSDGRIFWW